MTKRDKDRKRLEQWEDKIEQWQERKLAWLKYYWEFMRRSPEYRADYKEVERLRKQAKYSPDMCEEEVSPTGCKSIYYPYVDTPEWKKELEFIRKYNLSEAFLMPDPNKSFEELLKEHGGDTKRLLLLFNLAKVKKPLRTIVQWELDGRKSREGRIRFEVDFDVVNSIDALKERIVLEIDFHWERYRSGTAKKMIDYDRLLRIGRLRDYEGLTFEEIGRREIDPEGKNPESAKQNAYQLYEKYRQLVDEGYKDITFP